MKKNWLTLMMISMTVIMQKHSSKFVSDGIYPYLF